MAAKKAKKIIRAVSASSIAPQPEDRRRQMRSRWESEDSWKVTKRAPKGQ